MKENSRTIQSQNTKNKIYQTSIRLFKEHGYDHVTIQDIATSANVSVGSFYNHFQSKENILHEKYFLADEVFKEFIATGIPGKDQKERIKLYMLRYIDFVLTHPLDFIKILYNTDNMLFLKEGRPMQTLLNPLIKDAKEEGEITSHLTVDEINEFLFLSMRGLIFHWCLHNGSFDLYHRADTYLSIILKSL